MCDNSPIHSADVGARLSFKCHNEINHLDNEERDHLETMLSDNYASRMSQVDDETLMQIAVQKGLIL